jgi:hypothetical protein
MNNSDRQHLLNERQRVGVRRRSLQMRYPASAACAAASLATGTRNGLQLT